MEEYNKESKSQLKFLSVVKGETQVVSGTNYRLIVATKDQPRKHEPQTPTVKKEELKTLWDFEKWI
ncbi:hypothetical protein SO802_005925 [Lithocarpus litseifolius]|uniref:Cystatin domain-containing protein n=1 Tax=Lithocarpus litseifolius TaxID=425828 RepID=A0AAW2DM10_9ROSI